jgi:protein-disulfide isomerase
MRFSRVVVALVVICLAATVGCTRQIAGTAKQDPHAPGTALTDDGFGIIAGDPEAPIQIELFTEPQCSHCAELQADFGKEIASYINLGQLAVTYRPMVFLDTPTNDHSARVSNALFLAVGPDTSGPAFQAFVEDLWAHQDPGGSVTTDAEIANMARQSGVGSAEADKIAAGDEALNIKDMADSNFSYLYEIDPLDTGTPTVYDVANDEKIDIYDNNWLSKLMSSH